MRNAALILVGLMAACGTNDGVDDPHKVVTCDSGWVSQSGQPTPVTSCEAACQAPPDMTATGNSECKVGGFPDEPLYCPNVYFVGDGCCSPQSDRVRFTPCM